MEGRLPELLALTIVMLVAVSMGILLVRLKQPPVVGYIIAGVLLGPAGVALVPQANTIPLLAELGVLMLLFVVGMELSLRAFILDLRPAVITVLGQLAFGLLLTFGFGWAFGWSFAQSLLLGFVIFMSSTAVGLKTLEDIGELRSEIGRITVAVMIAQDIAIVPILILVHSIGDEAGIAAESWLAVGVTVASLILLIRALARPGKLHFPGTAIIHGRVELLTLTMLAVCFTAATLTGLFGMSPAYGAFVAGLIIGKTSLRSEALHVLEPIQSVLMVIFFVSIGLLLDISFIIERWQLVLLFVIAVLVLKSMFNIAILRVAGIPWHNAVTAGLIMGQIGEFSFVLTSVGLATAVLDPDGYRLAIAVIALSLLLSPVWMSAVRRVQTAAEAGLTDYRLALSAFRSDAVNLAGADAETLSKAAAVPMSVHLKLAQQAATRGLRQTRPRPAAGDARATAPDEPLQDDVSRQARADETEAADGVAAAESPEMPSTKPSTKSG